MKFLNIILLGLVFQLSLSESCWSMAKSLPDQTLLGQHLLNEKPNLSKASYREHLLERAVSYAKLHGAELELNIENPRVLFYSALLVGDRELVEELISDHPELMNSTIQAGSDSGITSLMIAALSGSPGLFLDLLQKDASLLRKFSDHGLTPLHFAARAGALEIVKIILEQDPKQIDLTTANQLTSLHAAARSGVLSVVQLLYVRKPDWIVKTTTDTDLSVFHAAARSGSLEVVQFVLKPSVKTSVRLKLLRMFNDDTTRVAKGYKTPFHFAIRSQSNDVLSYLANQSTCLTMINTPLVIAVEKNLHDQVEHVLQLDPEAANSNFLTIKGIGIESNLMHRAIECGHPKILEVLIHHDLKKKSDRWLKREFIDPPKMMARCDHQGKTPLELAISKGMIAFVKQLVEAEPEQIIRSSITLERGPLGEAIRTNQVELLRVLLLAEPTLKDKIHQSILAQQNTTLLHEAVRNNQIEIAQFLVAWDPSLLRRSAGKYKVTAKGLADHLDFQPLSQLLQDAQILLALFERNESMLLGSLGFFTENQLELVRSFLIYVQKNHYNPSQVYRQFLKKLHRQLKSESTPNVDLLENLEKVMEVYREYLGSSTSLKHLCFRSLQSQISDQNPSQHPQSDLISGVFQAWAEGYLIDLIPRDIHPVEYDSYGKMMKRYLKDFNQD